MKLILTCEHAGNEVPAAYAKYFLNAAQDLKTHRGYDPGARDLLEHLQDLAVWNRCFMDTRLLIEPNRSIHHRDLFSEISRDMAPEEKAALLMASYMPYRNAVQQRIADFIEKGEKVCHLSVHTFTPELNGKVRTAEIGLLYDPSRAGEKEFAAKLKSVVQKEESGLRVRFNYPYLGKADGFTTTLRRMFGENYIGIELEVNQKFVAEDKMDQEIKNVVYSSIKTVLQPK